MQYRLTPNDFYRAGQEEARQAHESDSVVTLESLLRQVPYCLDDCDDCDYLNRDDCHLAWAQGYLSVAG